MSILKAGVVNEVVLGARLKYITFSGTVAVDGQPASRVIEVYKIGQERKYWETVSEEDGTWELQMSGNSSDEFRIICVGNVGENSVIYEHVFKQGE